MKEVKFELYTRPTCSDCQDAKAFLAENNIPYIDHDLSKEPEKEKDLIKIAGMRMVPTFIFENKSMLGLVNKPKVLIGFEQNFDEIKKVVEDVVSQVGKTYKLHFLNQGVNIGV